MSIYDKPVWQLMREMVEEFDLEREEILTRERVLEWFSKNYPKIKKATVSAHLLRMSTNAPSRIYYIGKTTDDDLLYQVDSSRFRLYEPESDPPPIDEDTADLLEPGDDELGSTEFAYEADLKNYLSKNLSLLEPGLTLYEDEGIKGIEFPAGGRFIDLLGVGQDDSLVVIELKVSRGYDRVVGQLLRYIGWIKENLAEESQKVRGVIVARSISDDLTLACRDLPNVHLLEYEIAVQIKEITGS